MVKVLFVSRGNICRSPMAEYLMKDMVNYRQLNDRIKVSSTGMIESCRGMSIAPKTKEILDSVSVPFEEEHIGKVLEDEDYNQWDYLVCMDQVEQKELEARFDGDPEGKIHRLLEYTEREEKDIPDPWFTGDFDETYDDMLLGLSGFLKRLGEKIKTGEESKYAN